MPKLNTLYIDEKYIDLLVVPETVEVEKQIGMLDIIVHLICNYCKNECSINPWLLIL